jgi:hypothetical protein
MGTPTGEIGGMDIKALLGREGLDFLFGGDSSSPYPVAPHRERKDLLLLTDTCMAKTRDHDVASAFYL